MECLKAYEKDPSGEFEVRFGSVERSGYREVLARLAGAGFKVSRDEKLLRINVGDVRAEVRGIVSINAFSDSDSPTYAEAFLKKTKVCQEVSDWGLKYVFSREAALAEDAVERVKLDWHNQQKTYRFIHRVRLQTEEFPEFVVDCSAVKRGHASLTFEESATVGQPETYEIEIEAVQASPHFKAHLARIVTHVLAGIQGTDYPVKRGELDTVLNEYETLVRADRAQPAFKRFIGPNMVALQLHNLGAGFKVAADDEELSQEDNGYSVQTGYAITDKADGARKMLFIASTGKLYYLTSKMKVQFTGKTSPRRMVLLDGEHLPDLYVAFDCYFFEGKDVRGAPLAERCDRIDDALEGTGWQRKKFYTGDLFAACDQCLKAVVPYPTDGLVFTPTSGLPITTQLTTWDRCFKWKPVPTIDFKVFVKESAAAATTLVLCVNANASNHDNPYESILRQEGTLVRTKEGLRPFVTMEDPRSHLCTVEHPDGKMVVGGQALASEMVVEFSYDGKWTPLRVRADKDTPNTFMTAHNTWNAIQCPITAEMLTGKVPCVGNRYYVGDKRSMRNLRKFHGDVKRSLLLEFCKPGTNLVDFGTGVGGDLHRWRQARLNFVFGVDPNEQNIYNKKDGACIRYLETTSKHSNLYAIFTVADATKPVRTVDAVSKAIFGLEPRAGIDPRHKNVIKHWNTKFQTASAMFSVHYMFRSKETLEGFVQNLVDCVELNGHFIGTAWDGSALFKELTCGDLVLESVRVVKRYAHDEFPDDERSLGYAIDVFQSTFVGTEEYLVNFKFFEAIMFSRGFHLVDIRPFTTYYNESFALSASDKKASFLNRAFIFKKIEHVPIRSSKK